MTSMYTSICFNYLFRICFSFTYFSKLFSNVLVIYFSFAYFSKFFRKALMISDDIEQKNYSQWFLRKKIVKTIQIYKRIFSSKMLSYERISLIHYDTYLAICLNRNKHKTFFHCKKNSCRFCNWYLKNDYILDFNYIILV